MVYSATCPLEPEPVLLMLGRTERQSEPDHPSQLLARSKRVARPLNSACGQLLLLLLPEFLFLASTRLVVPEEPQILSEMSSCDSHGPRREGIAGLHALQKRNQGFDHPRSFSFPANRGVQVLQVCAVVLETESLGEVRPPVLQILEAQDSVQMRQTAVSSSAPQRRRRCLLYSACRRHLLSSGWGVRAIPGRSDRSKRGPPDRGQDLAPPG